MAKPIESDAEFVRGLTARERDYFLERESALQIRLQSALRDFSRGLGTIGALNCESQGLVLVEASRRTPSKTIRSMTISAETIRAYTQTHYRVASKLGWFVLRVGEQSDPVRELHTLAGVSSSVFITACNPFGVAQSDAKNAKAMQCLKEHLRDMGVKSLEGEGRGDDGTWPAEPSVLALGVPRKGAQELCTKFDQNAVVFISEDAVPRLQYHPSAVLLGAES